MDNTKRPAANGSYFVPQSQVQPAASLVPKSGPSNKVQSSATTALDLPDGDKLPMPTLQ